MSNLAGTLPLELGGDLGAVPGAYSRMLIALLPPGKLWQLLGESTLQKLLLACGNELARVELRVADMLNEADPRTTLELLPDFERELDLVPDPSMTTDERRANVIARLLRRQGFKPADFQTALAPLLGLAAVDVVIIERTRAFAIAIGVDSEIYRFFVYRNPALPGTAFIASAQVMLDLMKPSHTAGQVIQSISFLTDDPFSLTDRDILGA